jgi:hypothetical protein
MKEEAVSPVDPLSYLIVGAGIFAGAVVSGLVGCAFSPDRSSRPGVTMPRLLALFARWRAARRAARLRRIQHIVDKGLSVID